MKIVLGIVVISAAMLAYVASTTAATHFTNGVHGHAVGGVHVCKNGRWINGACRGMVEQHNSPAHRAFREMHGMH